MKRISDDMISRAEVSMRKLKKQFKGDPNIIGFAIGYKERKGEPISKCSLKVYVKEKFAESVITKHRMLPKEVDGVLVDVIRRDYQLQQNPRNKFDPLVAGVQVANGNNDGVYGTVGAIVNTPNGDHFLLSNWHVLYGREDAQDYEPIYQPRKNSLSQVGETVVGIINSNVDCALANFNYTREINQSILEVAPAVFGVANAIHPGMEVVKYGVNGKAVGEIISVTKDHEFSVPWMEDSYKVEDQLEIKQVEGEPFNMDLGDSGSLWVTRESQPKAVALHFAGKRNKYSLANPIKHVVKELNNSGYEIQF